MSLLSFCYKKVVNKMASPEDDEIDILGGEFNLDNFLLSKNDSGIYENSTLVSQNSDLLYCDYTIHPQWLLDKPSANPDCWYDTNSALPSDPPADENGTTVSTENSITDESGWTEKEKNLLERGIEIFGKSNVRLAQFIGSKSSTEVKYYFKNFYMDGVASGSGSGNYYKSIYHHGSGMEETNLVSDILNDNQIPASIEEVIAAVSTACPTIPETQTKPPTKVKTNRKKAKFKIKTRLKFPMPSTKIMKQKTVKFMDESSRKTGIGKVEITTGKGLSVPLCEGEEIVKISKDTSDSDIEVDIEDVDEVKKQHKTEVRSTTKETPTAVESVDNLSNDSPCDSIKTCKKTPYIDLSTLDEHLVEQLTSLDTPQSEFKVHPNFISELEKVIHSEFFEGRPTKTPLRYLKIRNHIVNCWIASKPNYVTKTSIRQGLKNCGDVNSISRVHCYLEQTGAINYGSQVKYTRPLFDVFQTFVKEATTSKTKDVTLPLKATTSNGNSDKNDLGPRARIKRKFHFDHVKNQDGEGGCTLTHDDQGHVINTTIVKEEPPKPRVVMRKPISLIYCRPFPDEQPYKIELNLTTLLSMDFHSHSSLSEVMGLIAGTWDPLRKQLTIAHYEPCKNVASSATHCDMCPISQSRAAELIHDKGLGVLGWFHSHPTFAPEPSQQDLDTQQDMQHWMSRGGWGDTPCLGVILSPFSSHGALIASPFRCMAVGRRANLEGRFVPYRFDVRIVGDEENLEEFLEGVRRVKKGAGCVDFSKPYFQDLSISFAEKFVTSVKMHLAKCGVMNKMACDRVLESICSILKK